MDKSPYNNYSLAVATLNLARRIRRENPELWAKIQEDGRKFEEEKKKRDAQ